MSRLPGGTVTFLFSDIEGSTRLIQELGTDYQPLLAEHRRLIGEAIAAEGGAVFGSEGDSLYAAFDGATPAVRAAAAAQRALEAYPWPPNGRFRARMGVHSGDAAPVGEDYVGLTLHEVARVMGAGHGGQVVVSGPTHQLVSDALPADLAMTYLGEHQLKDLPRPVRLFQLTADGLAQDFPPLRTRASRPTNLPVLMTSFIGRGELEEAHRALAQTRLLTLTGPGGTGKTRLALHLAADLLDKYPDGVFFVELESVTDPALVPAAIGSVITVGALPGRPPLDALLDHLRDRQLLLVLDNFEQVLDAAPMVGQLLREAPGLRVLVTSRSVLRVYGEHELPLAPLSLPRAGRGGAMNAALAGASDAVRLFVDRARAAQPAFVLDDANAAAVAEIVSRLDGLPLAIELAAARTRVLPVEAIRARLDQRLALLTGGARDLPARQQTLRGAIDWSFQLLEPPERTLLERFSVFAGGAFLPEAEAVCGPATEVGIDVLEGLSALADKSLLRAIVVGAEEPRFAMLATIRDYCAEQLEANGDAEQARARHCQAFSQLVDRCGPLLTQSGGRVWQDRLEIDHDNLRAAFDWALEQGQTTTVLSLVAGLWRFWQARGHLHEARRRVDRALAMPGVMEQPAMLRHRAFSAGGGVAYWQGDFVPANSWYQLALTAAEETGDRAEIALASYNFGFAALDRPTLSQDERYRAGRPWFERALALHRELGQEAGVADAEWGLALSAAASADLLGAHGHALRALEVYRRLDNAFGVGWAAHMLALYCLALERTEEAFTYAGEALSTFEGLRDLSGMVLVAYDVGLLLLSEGRREAGLRIAGAIDALREENGLGVIGDGFNHIAWKTPEQPIDPGELVLWREGATWSVEQVTAYARQYTPRTAPG